MELKNKFFILFLPIIFSSCTYYSFKGSLPANIDNISISPILNESTEYVVTDILDEEIYNILLKENVLKLVGIDNAKSKLDITIKSVTDKYYTYSLGEVQYEIVDEWKISVKAKVEWYDLLEDKVIFSKEMTSFGIYSTNSGNDISVDGIDNDQDGLTDNEDNDEFGPPRESALKIASKKLSENIIANITSTW